jgi:hypothetical protein
MKEQEVMGRTNCLLFFQFQYLIRQGGMMYIPSFMTAVSDMQVLLRLLPQEFERLLCWRYRWERFMKYACQMASDNTAQRLFMTIGTWMDGWVDG